MVLDLIDIGPHLLGWGDDVSAKAVEQVRQCHVAVFASPTYKGSYTGLLEAVPGPGSDRRASMACSRFPVMLGAAMGHAMAPDLLLKPVLVELGASCPARGLYLLETDYTSEEHRRRLGRSGATVLYGRTVTAASGRSTHGGTTLQAHGPVSAPPDVRGGTQFQRASSRPPCVTSSVIRTR